MTDLTPQTDYLSMSDAQKAQIELNRRVANEKYRYYTPNGRAEEFLNNLKQFKPGHAGIIYLILRAGNSFGKSALACNIAAYLCRRKPNPWFEAIPYLREFKRPCRGRIYTTANAAANTYQDEIGKWFPKSSYTPMKEGRSYNHKYLFKNRSNFDFFTFDQDTEQAESVTLDWQIVDEPPPHKLFSAMKTRLRFGGIIIFVLTPLEAAAWMSDELELPERIGKDVFITVADTEDACIEHGIRGHLPHASIEAMFKDFDEAEMGARKGGAYLHLSGRIFKNYRAEPDKHEPEEIHDYHTQEWKDGRFTLYNVMDPHDRKPFAIGWYAVFANGDAYTIAEWPDDTWPPFRKMKDCPWMPIDYARMMLNTEQELGKFAEVRIIDPNFGNTPCYATKTTIKYDLTGAAKSLQDKGEAPADFTLNYQDAPDSIEGGHIAIKSLLGNPAKGVRSKFYVLKHCKNHSFGMTRYGWGENKNEDKRGISEKPELVHKDFPDLVRYFALSKPKYVPPALPVELFKQRKYGSSTYRGA